MTSWVDHVIWWQLHPISFLGAPDRWDPAAAQDDRLGRLEPWLDYLVELGCNGLALGPVFASESHGYDTVDHFRVDPRLGTEADLEALFRACRRRGVRVLLDGVFNHVGRGFGPFRDVLAHGRDSRYASWFRLDFDSPATTSAPSLTTAGADGFGYADFEGHRHLVALNHDEPAVVEYVADVMDHWLRRGADGWRLDAAYAVPTRFWHQVIPRVRRDHPDAWIVGEVIHGDYAQIVADGGLDSVTQYELWKAIWSSLNDRNFFELSWALSRHEDWSAGFRPLTFVGNHDVTRLASRLDDERHLPHALVVLFTVAGVPSVYAGDEQAFRGVKYERADGDAEIRPAFPDHPGQLAPYGSATRRLHQDLIGLRRRHPWLVASRPKVIHLDNQRFAFQALDPDGGPGLVVALNLSDEPFILGPESAAARRLLGGPGPGPESGPGFGADPGADLGADPGADPGAAHVVAPHGWAVLQLAGDEVDARS